jgi:hypothetical protein
METVDARHRAFAVVVAAPACHEGWHDTGHGEPA